MSRLHRAIGLGTAALAVIVLGAWAAIRWSARGTRSTVIDHGLAAKSNIPSPQSQACGQCHQIAYDNWMRSQHARANRLFDPAIQVDDDLQRTSGHGPEAVIGIEPLEQYLIAFPGGRLQALDLAFDPAKRESFNIYGTENRQPHEWGYWKNRGMNWNSQCAFCHMTNLRKNYDLRTDSYHTDWDEMGIGCAQCHGPMPQHSANPDAPVAEGVFTPERVMHNCASCHARREELTGTFQAGESFFDHYRLSLPSEPGLYYADGQVREEDYEFGSFLMSRLSQKGIVCTDCHNAHSGKLHKPVDDNQLCLLCHLAPGNRGAVVIDPPAHSHHKPDSKGNLCVECHMPVTVYMARDPRRDHGFTSPDPRLTKELGIPNACNRCHTDQSTEWAIVWTQKWYGDKMDHSARLRARVVARVQDGDVSVATDLLRMARDEENAVWRAALVTMLETYAGRSDVRGFLTASLTHFHPLVRAVAVRALPVLPETTAQIAALRKDPSRLVRIDATWATMGRAEPNPDSYRELMNYLNFTSDQPAGALRQAQLAVMENRGEDAETWARKTVAWDPSAVSYAALAQVLHYRGKSGEAAAAFAKAAELDPKTADYPYALALLYGEMGRSADAAAQLQRAVQLDPRFGRAWYNLGLALAQQNDLDGAVAALIKAESLMPDSPEPPYARATVHARQGHVAEARAAVIKALEIAPDYSPARQLSAQLP